MKNNFGTRRAFCGGPSLLRNIGRSSVGLIFLRYISAAFEKRYAELVAEGDGFEDDPDAYMEDNIFFVPETAR